MSDERIYVIGNRGSGVVLLRLNPLRVVVIEDAEIKRFSDATKTDGYAKLAAAFWRLTADLRDNKVDANKGDLSASVGIETVVSNGVKLTEVDFVYAAKLASASTDDIITFDFDSNITMNHIEAKITTELPGWITFYSPASDAISRLFVKDGENIQSAVLSDP
ncbi:hypothetical protein [Labrys neptuniae]